MNELTIRLIISDLIEQLEPALRKIMREEIDRVLEMSKENDPTLPVKDLMTTKEAAQYLGLSSITLYRLRHDGKIGFFRVANGVMFSHAEHIKPFLASVERRRT